MQICNGVKRSVHDVKRGCLSENSEGVKIGDPELTQSSRDPFTNS